MKFDDLDAKMRTFETAHDHCVMPDVYAVLRLDGRSFTKMTVNAFCEKPYDKRFSDAMVDVTEELMTSSGVSAIYGYTQSDEISLLLSLRFSEFNRKERKLISVMAGEASARLTFKLDVVAAFDCRVSQLPSPDLVCDYFRWRQADATRNALNSCCHWTLIKSGLSTRAATQRVKCLNVSDKNELLFKHGVNFNELTLRQRRGVGLRWVEYDKVGHNPVLGQDVTVKRRKVERCYELPLGDDYGELIREVVKYDH